jgi:phosphatidylinositol dimannoside acyltransferase
VSPAADGTRPERKQLVAPHRRTGNRRFRPAEKAAIWGYRAGMWLMSRLPVRVARGMVSFALQLSFVLWPKKRRYVNDNFAHVLGKPPGSLEVKRKALAAYRSYARYVVELMRLPRLSNEQAAELVDTSSMLPLEASWKASGKGLIITSAHIGNLEGVARGIARHGWPVSSLGDDTTFPELFDLLRRQRREWGINLIPWRNLREMFGVMRRNEVLALVIDWGYRADDIPVRMFGAWTTLPAGPAAIAAKTGAPIVHVAIRRAPDGRTFQLTHGEPIVVASSDAAELQRATQAIADALAATIAAAPEQWYSFKPMWPSTAEEQAALEERAAAMARGEPAPAGRSRRGDVAGASPGSPAEPVPAS